MKLELILILLLQICVVFWGETCNEDNPCVRFCCATCQNDTNISDQPIKNVKKPFNSLFGEPCESMEELGENEWWLTKVKKRIFKSYSKKHNL
jgi:hypothetical protein